MFYGLLFIPDSWILVQCGTECDQLVCKGLQGFLFVLTAAAVDAFESSWIIKRKHLQCKQYYVEKQKYMAILLYSVKQELLSKTIKSIINNYKI